MNGSRAYGTKPLFAIGSFIALLMGWVGASATSAANSSSPWGEGYFPNLAVVDQDGHRLSFYNDVLKGKTVVISFFFTSCQDICPLTTARLAQVRDKLGDAFGRDVFFVSLTVDPETDTPGKLKKFADAFHTGPGWTFLTGTLEDIRAINRKLGDRSISPRDHRNEIVLGNDSTGEWARNTALGELDRLTIDILQMNPEWRNAKRDIGNDNAQAGVVALTDHKGEVLFRKICSSCHTVGVGDRIGPDLRGVTGRRDSTWLRNYIMDPSLMLKSGDPIAAKLDAAYPDVVMPAFGLTEEDSADLIAYLQLATDRLSSKTYQDAISRTPGHALHDHAGHAYHEHGNAGMLHTRK